MGKRGKLDREFMEEDERIRSSEKASKSEASSTDDEVANEDLSLKIVEKALLMRAVRLVTDDVVSLEPNGEPQEVAAGPNMVAGAEVVVASEAHGKKLIKERKKKIKKTEIADQNVVVMKEDEKLEVIKTVAEATEPNPVEIAVADNIVLRKLLRGPRYFDPPDTSWGTCYNCGEEGHAAVNCKSAKRRKPCFVCGSLEHNAKQCTKGQDCFICKKGGHRAKDCPDKHKSSSIRSKICLKCGENGHDMFSCRNGYLHDDLKDICCYVCKSFGHLCCVKYGDCCHKEVSCYRCGELGHTGLSCTRLHGETTGTESASSCYRCGEEGHFARECTNTFKAVKRNREPSTLALRFHREQKHNKGFKSTPHDLDKARKKKKAQYEGNGILTPQKSKHRGGWIMEDPGDFSFDNGRNNSWRSPATPSSKDHRIPYLSGGSHLSNSQSKRTRKASGTTNFERSSNVKQSRSGMRFGNSSNGGNRRNYDWW